jgi:hypothetical protein
MPLYYLQRLGILTLFAAGLLTGCASSPRLGPPSTDDVSLVFGHINMDQASAKLDSVQMKRIYPETRTPYYNFWVVDGTFFRADVPKGTYDFTSFGGHSGLKNKSHEYDFPGHGKGKVSPRITIPATYFVGSFRYSGIDNAGNAILVPAKAPSEYELLRKILPYAKDPYWSNMIKKRLNRLK